MSLMVHLESRRAYPDRGNHEVVGFLTNNTVGDLTCTVAFHKNGHWTEYQTGILPEGAKHVGGEMGGTWTVDADSPNMKYACFMGRDPVDVHGKSCNYNLNFSEL